MVGFLQQRFFNSNFPEASNGVQNHPTREIPTNLAVNFLSTQDTRNQPEIHTQPSLYDRLTAVVSLQTYISSALKIKKIWQSFIDLVNSSQSLQVIGQFFSKKFKGINISAIQLNNSFSFFKRKEIHHHTEIIHYHESSENTTSAIVQIFEEKINTLKDQLHTQTQKNEELTQELKVQSQKNEQMKGILTEAFASNAKNRLTLNTTRKRTISCPTHLIT